MTRQRTIWGLLVTLGLALVAGIGTDAGRAAREDTKSALPADLARVPSDAFFVSSVRMADIWNSVAAKGIRDQMKKTFPDLLADFEKWFGFGVPDIERLTMVAHGIMGDSEPVFVVATVKPFDKERLLKTALPKRTLKKVGAYTVYLGAERKAVAFLGASTYVFGDPRSVEWFVEQPAKSKEGPQTAVLQAAAEKHAVVVGINPEPLVPLSEQLPAEAEAFKPLIAAKSSLVTLDIKDNKIHVSARGTFANAKDADKAEKAVGSVRELAQGFVGQMLQKAEKEGKDWERIVELLKVADASLKDAKITRKDAVVQASVVSSTDLSVLNVALIEAVQKIRESAKRIQDANNLRQFALAMHNYMDTYGTFPANAVYDKNGKPLLSWRVQILPFIEQDALYKEFHLDEPWDSEHNKKLLEQMPKIFETVEGERKKGYLTRYQGFVGKGAFFDGTAKGLRIADITDGTSNTIMIVEAAKGVPWTKPEDVPFDNGKLLPRLGGVFKGGFNVAMCDGSVRFISNKISETTLRAAVTTAGGEVLGNDF
jgi:prepilin-type processing-associated H-X9-DG protein